MNERKINFTTKLAILHGNPVIFLIGLVLTLLPIMFAGVHYLVFSLSNVKTIESKEYRLVQSNGKNFKARIVDVQVKKNIIVNGHHPVVVYYEYKKNGDDIVDNFVAINTYSKILKGDSINIKEYRNTSIIPSLTPFVLNNFSWLYYLFFTGLTFLLITYKNYRKKLNLIKTGKLVKGKIYKIEIYGKTILYTQSIKRVHYNYSGSNGNQLKGKGIIQNYKNYKVGDEIPIIVQKDNESISIVYLI